MKFIHTIYAHDVNVHCHLFTSFSFDNSAQSNSKFDDGYCNISNFPTSLLARYSFHAPDNLTHT